MEEQTTDVEVTVKTLDSQSRTYTVSPQVKSTPTTKTDFFFQSPCVLITNVPSISSVVDGQRV